MRIKVNVKLNPKARKAIKDGANKALPLTMEAMKTEINNMQIVPKDTGNLEESVATGAEGNIGYISYGGSGAPYARRLSYHPEYNFRTDKNPNAQGRWFDSFIYGDKKEWLAKTFAEKLKENSNGVIK